MTTVLVGTDVLHPTHDLSFTDGSVTIGITLCDSAGNLTDHAIAKNNQTTTTMQVTQGDSGYDNYEPQYSPIVQSDFTGGMGQIEFDKDKTKYWYGENIDTSKGDVIMGPYAHPATGGSYAGWWRTHWFEYKGQLYFATGATNGIPGKIFMNGWRGAEVASTAAGTVLAYAAQAFPENGVAGKIYKRVSGPGYEERQNFRLISSNTSGSLTVDRPWRSTSSVQTGYAILGSDEFTEITGFNFYQPFDSVMVVGDFVIFTGNNQNSDRAIRMYEQYTAGSLGWSRSFWGDTASSAAHSASGGRKMYVAHPQSNRVFGADWPATYSTGAAYSPEIACGDQYERINKILTYTADSGQLTCFVLKEGSIGYLTYSSGAYAYTEVQLPELKSVKDALNGAAAVAHGPYLYLSYKDSVERYYQSTLKDLSFNDDGVVDEVFGKKLHCDYLLAYAGSIFAIFNPGGVIVKYNGTGWCIVYSATSALDGVDPDLNEITGAYIQPMPEGSGYPERLWFSIYNSTSNTTVNKYIHVSKDPKSADGFHFAPSGVLITSWAYSSMKDVNKFYKELTAFIENIDAGEVDLFPFIKGYYQVEDGTTTGTWTEIGKFDESPSEKLTLSSDYDVAGKRIRLKFEIKNAPEGSYSTTSARILSYVLDAVKRIPTRASWTVTFMVDDTGTDKNGDHQDLRAYDKLYYLERWGDSTVAKTPLTMGANYDLFDGKRVFIDPPVYRPIKTDSDPKRSGKYICTMKIIEV